MSRRALVAAAVVALAACNSYETTGPLTDLGAPTNLSYQLVPSGDPDVPLGIVLEWEPPQDPLVTHYVVYSRGSSAEQWSKRAETTSASFHDNGVPDLEYYVTAAADDGSESIGSNVVIVDASNRLSPPSSLGSISLNQAVQLSWPADARLAEPGLFDYYRVYSTPYDLDRDRCDVDGWVLEGTTVSEDFIASGLPNGAPRCFAVSTVSRDGHESDWSDARADTPRFDSRNVLLWAAQSALDESGFRFQFPGSNVLGTITSGARSDIDFRVDRHGDGSLWLTPVRGGTRVALYSTTPVEDLTSIDIAPLGGFSTGAIEAVPGFAYVFETQLANGLHYGGVRVTHVGADYLIFDWSYQSDPGNPELSRVGQ